jgi:hypothetical protein
LPFRFEGVYALYGGDVCGVAVEVGRAAAFANIESSYSLVYPAWIVKKAMPFSSFAYIIPFTRRSLGKVRSMRP